VGDSEAVAELSQGGVGLRNCSTIIMEGRVTVKRKWNSHGVTEGTERM